MIRKFKFLLPVVFIMGFSTSFKNVENTDPKDKVLITILNYVLTQWHYHPQDINDSFSNNLFNNFIEDIGILNKLGLSIIVVHGGGPRIKRELEKSNIPTKFIKGLRVTDKNIINICEKNNVEIIISSNKN